jgi:hypothetical protein
MSIKALDIAELLVVIFAVVVIITTDAIII